MTFLLSSLGITHCRIARRDSIFGYLQIDIGSGYPLIVSDRKALL